MVVNNIFNVKGKTIVLSIDGPKEGNAYPGFVNLSEINFDKNLYTKIFSDYKNYSIKHSEQIGDDVYVLISNVTLSTTKLIKTKAVEVK
jgi:hypothetical protein